MRILPPIEEELRRAIRDARAADPVVTVSGLQSVLEERFNRGFSRKYVGKLADKVHRETLMEANRAKLDQRLTATREKFRIMSERLLRIINWEAEKDPVRFEGESLKDFMKRIMGPSDEDVIEAVKVLGMLDLALLKAEIECGMYKDEETALAEHRTYTTLPDEQRNSIVAAFNKWGYLNKGTVARLTERSITVYAGNNAAGPSA